MRITKIRAVGATNVDFPIVGAAPSGKFVLQNSTGLDPVEIVVREDGSRAVQDREITLMVGLQPQWNTGETAEQIRSQLYRLLTPPHGKTIKLQLMDGNTVIAYANGQIKKMEAGLFVKEPMVQITFTCLGATRSYFLGSELTIEPTITYDTGFTRFSVDNPGSAESPFAMNIRLTSPVTVGGAPPPGIPSDLAVWGLLISLNDDLVPPYMKMYAIEMEVDEMLHIDTRFSVKAYDRYPDVVDPEPESLIYALTAKSVWMKLQPGVNDFVISETVVWADDDLGFAFKYTPAYLGV